MADILVAVLDDARSAGFLGPGPLELHLRHARAFVALCRRLSTAVARPRIMDLGSGGGLPGLVLAVEWPESEVVLLDASARRAGFLSSAVDRCEVSRRVTVVCARAEEYGQDPGSRHTFTGAVARSFGPPAVVAECAAPLLVPGGWLVVSEPPEPPGSRDGSAEGLPPLRWPPEGLAELGLVPAERVAEPFAFQVLRQEHPCPERFPRRNGVPAKRPLF